MGKFEELKYSDNCSEIVKEVRDRQLAAGINTIFACAIESIQLYQDNIVELILQFRLQSYPDQLIDKYTFYSQQRHLIKDIEGAIFADPWDDNTVDLFADIYSFGHKKFVDSFRNQLGELANDFNKNETVVNDENTRRIASEILQFYANKLNNH